MHLYRFVLRLCVPDPVGERAYCAPQTSYVDFRGPTSKGLKDGKKGKEFSVHKKFLAPPLDEFH